MGRKKKYVYIDKNLIDEVIEYLEKNDKIAIDTFKSEDKYISKAVNYFIRFSLEKLKGKEQLND